MIVISYTNLCCDTSYGGPTTLKFLATLVSCGGG